MRKIVHISKETWEKDGIFFSRSWCSLKTIVKSPLPGPEQLANALLEDSLCRNCMRAKNKQKTFIVTSGHNYSGKLGTIPALFRFKKCYHLSKGKRVEFMEKLGQDNGRWLTGIVDDFIDQPGHKYIFISKF